MANLDHDAAWSRALEGEGATQHADASDHCCAGLREVCVLGLDFHRAGQIEADVKPAWIGQQFRWAEFAERNVSMTLLHPAS